VVVLSLELVVDLLEEEVRPLDLERPLEDDGDFLLLDDEVDLPFDLERRSTDLGRERDLLRPRRSSLVVVEEDEEDFFLVRSVVGPTTASLEPSLLVGLFCRARHVSYCEGRSRLELDVVVVAAVFTGVDASMVAPGSFIFLR